MMLVIGIEVNMSCFILTNIEKFFISIFPLLGTLVVVKIIMVVLYQNNCNTIYDVHALFSEEVYCLFFISLFIKIMLTNNIV